MEEDSHHQQSILIAVVGMSPAILTETVWALAHEPSPVIPEKVIAITTLEGKKAIIRDLFTPDPTRGNLTVWEQLRSDLAGKDKPHSNILQFGCTGDDIRVITHFNQESGVNSELDDIRNQEENMAVGNYLLENIRSVVENPDKRLIASIAGGRKTMGALLYACMTLIARETDRLTHVLVSPPYDQCREFFFPSQLNRSVSHRQEIIQANNAEIELADVPFVPLRNLFSRELGRSAGSFSNLIETCRINIRARASEEIQLEVETSKTQILVNKKVLKLSPMEHALFLFLAVRAEKCEPPLGAYAEAEDLLNDFCSELTQNAPSNNLGDWRYSDSLSSDWDEESIRKNLSSIRRKLRRMDDPNGQALASCLPEKGRFSLELAAEQIFVKH